MSESLKDRLKARALALQVEAQSSLESARQKAASIDVSKIKERAAALAETARSRLEAPSTEGGPDPGCESGSDADSEQRSLVSGARDRLNSGLSQLPSLGYFGSRLGQLGEAGKSGLSQGMDGARQAKTRGAEGLRTAVAAGSSGVGRIKEGAKGAGGALTAAASASGLSVPGMEQEPPIKVCPCCPALSYKQRLIGCACCMLIGALLSLGSFLSFAKLLLGNPVPFALKYTLGNILSLGASSFLVGPARQCRTMFAKERRAASLAYLLTLAGTLLSIFWLRLAILALLFILLQFAALTWYMLSYIPYGRALASRLVRRQLVRHGVLSPATAPIRPAVEPS